MRSTILFLCAGALLLLAAGCQQRLERTLTSPERYETLDEASPYLKAHMQDGRVYVLSAWDADSAAVEGEGHLLGLSRDTLEQGRFAVPIDRVSIFETNVREPSRSVAALAIITGASVALTAYCATNPKACFGSCPTFYAPRGHASGDSLLQAEGFSSSVAPSLEQRDVDALYRSRPAERTFRLTMTNEALETHVVRRADLLLAERPGGTGRVLRGTDGAFWPARELQPPRACAAPEGDCRAAVQTLDERERFSPADSANLRAKETIDLAFEAPPPGERAGLVVGARQTLLTTFLLYQTLAYMGEDVGTWLAMLERSDRRLSGLGLDGLLGGVEVLVRGSGGAWQRAGAVAEHGPLASDVHVVPLPPAHSGSDTLHVRLRVTKGNWRLNYLALAELETPVQPLRVAPSAVQRLDTGDAASNALPDGNALAALRDSAQTLVTFPGDAYALSYRLPPTPERYEVFLESEGYYLEWMRREWMRETSRERVAEMLFSPQDMLRTLAPAFKAAEPSMESSFWNSRYER